MNCRSGERFAGGSRVPAETILRASGINKHFGGVHAVRDMSLEVARGQTVSVIGPNGAGKTTVFNLLSGVNPVDSGTIELDGRDITALPQHDVAKAGIARTFQNIRLFSGLSIAENVLISLDSRAGYGWHDAILRLGRYRTEDRESRAALDEYLDAVNLQNVAASKPSQLSYGHQRRVELARALAARPKVLLLDEPAAGFNPGEVDQFIELLQALKERYGLTILIIEHRMQVVMRMSDHVYVMNFGALIADGSASEIQRNPEVIKAYIGESNAVG